MNFISYVFAVIICLKVCDCSYRNNTSLQQKVQYGSWTKSAISKSSQQKFQDVFLSYSHNPFGLSVPLKDQIRSNRSISTGATSSRPHLPNQIDEVVTRQPNQIKFESIAYSVVDSGRGRQQQGDNQEFSSNNNNNNNNVQDGRRKRGVLELYNMVKCATGCNPFIYKGYGCYCGFLGSGYAVDGIDRCCQAHDFCYHRAHCLMFSEYIVPYQWTCFRNRPLCAWNQGYLGGLNFCAHRLCECDRVLSECLSRYSCPKSRAFCKSSPWRLIQNVLMIF